MKKNTTFFISLFKICRITRLIFHCYSRKILAIVLFIIFNFIFSFSVNAAITEESVNFLKTQTPNDWIAMALASAGVKNLPYEHLKNLSSTNATDYEKRILAITSLGFDPRDFFGQNFVANLATQYKNNQIGDPQLLNDDFWGILAFVSAGENADLEIIQKSKEFILAHQNKDGGWGYSILAASDTNDTAAAIMALLEVDLTKNSGQIKQAITYLKNTQNSDAGFPFQKNSFSDGASTAWVISALNKLGESQYFWQKYGKKPSDYLKSLEQADGSFKWQVSSQNSSLLVSAYALIALSSKYYPVKKFIPEKKSEKKEEIKEPDKKEENNKEPEKKEEETKKEEDKKDDNPIKKEEDLKTQDPIKKETIKKDKDSDNDGLSDKKEKYYKTNLKKWDTDNDKYSDGTEVEAGYDPLSSAPCPIKKFSKNPQIFAYGKRRLSPKSREKCYSKYLKNELKKQSAFGALGKTNFSKMQNAFIYGGYSVLDIAKAVKFNSKSVHPILQKSIWRKSMDYKIYSRK